MHKFFKLWPLAILMIISCDEQDSTPRYLINQSSGIDLRNIEVGDQAKYVLYQSDCDANFQFTGDTLEVEVIERNDSLFFKESYSEGSSIEIEAEHLIIPKDGYVLVPQRWNSQLLFFYGNDTIFLDRPTNVQLVQNGCRLFLGENAFIGEEIGSVERFSFGDFSISDRRGISCVPGFMAMEAYIFYEDYLNLVHTIRSGEQETIFGFMAIDN